MRFFGAAFFLIGLFALLLPQAGADFIYLKWTERWGLATSYLIRGGLMAFGAILWYIGKQRDGDGETY